MHKPKNQVCTLRLSICTYLLNTMYDKIAPPSYSSLPSNSQFLVGTSVVMFPIDVFQEYEFGNTFGCE